MHRHTVLLGALVWLAGCSSNRGITRDLPSQQEAWALGACTEAAPDFSTWTRRQVGSVTIAVPPGYTILQGPPYNIAIQGSARRTGMGFTFHTGQEGRRTFDSYYYGRRQFRHVCRTSLSGYTADVIGGFDRGQYLLVARWQVDWKGGDEGKELIATIYGTNLEEAIELRAILHTVRPVGASE